MEDLKEWKWAILMSIYFSSIRPSNFNPGLKDVEVRPKICKGSAKFYFDRSMWKNMSELSDNIEKLGPAHAILRG